MVTCTLGTYRNASAVKDKLALVLNERINILVGAGDSTAVDGKLTLVSYNSAVGCDSVSSALNGNIGSAAYTKRYIAQVNITVQRKNSAYGVIVYCLVDIGCVCKVCIVQFCDKLYSAHITFAVGISAFVRTLKIAVGADIAAIAESTTFIAHNSATVIAHYIMCSVSTRITVSSIAVIALLRADRQPEAEVCEHSARQIHQH